MQITHKFMQDKKIKKLINAFMIIPGLGPRSARRAVVHLLQDKVNLRKLIDNLDDTAKNVIVCKNCSNLSTSQPCDICQDKSRNNAILCVVPTVADLWALERTNCYNGYYHVLGGTLSAISGITPDKLNIPNLLTKLKDETITEIIMALGATLDAQTTITYLTDLVQSSFSNIKITTLSYGIPVGGELDYLDNNTITAAIKLRR